MKEGKFMYTSILVLAFSGFVSSANPDTPAWLNDYYTAVQQGAAQKKPVAVFLASGANGWKKLGNEGSLSREAQRLLASQYVCVHVDTATLEGKRLARAFDIPGGLGIVISDRTGQLQAFSHEGDLIDAKMVRYLQRYGDPQYVVSTTETNPSGQPERGAGFYSPPRVTVGRSC
jgi:hypothetical protein